MPNLLSNCLVQAVSSFKIILIELFVRPKVEPSFFKKMSEFRVSIIGLPVKTLGKKVLAIVMRQFFLIRSTTEASIEARRQQEQTS